MPEARSLLPQSSSTEYHDAHLAFARSEIVVAATRREPILDRLRQYTKDAAKAERERIVSALREQAECYAEPPFQHVGDGLRNAADFIETLSRVEDA